MEIKFNKTISTKHYSIRLTELKLFEENKIIAFGELYEDDYIEHLNCFIEDNHIICSIEDHKFNVYSFRVTINSNCKYIFSYVLAFTPLTENKIIEDIILAYTCLLQKFEDNLTIANEKRKLKNEETLKLKNNILRQIQNYEKCTS